MNGYRLTMSNGDAYDLVASIAGGWAGRRAGGCTGPATRQRSAQMILDLVSEGDLNSP